VRHGSADDEADGQFSRYTGPRLRLSDACAGTYRERMFLENVGFDTIDAQLVGRFWEAALGCTTLTDGPDGFETRLSIDGGPELDLCFQPVPALQPDDRRLHFDLLGGVNQAAVVERLLALGARPLDIGQHDVPWVVLADPQGGAFCVMEDRDVYTETGPIAGLPLDSSDPDRDAEFWSWLSGWVDAPGEAPRTLRHPSMRGPLLGLWHERTPKTSAKNRMHLDIRLEAGDDADAVAAGIVERGGQELHPDWGALPWRVYADPSGNEFCVLPISGSASHA
jgi:predicted enzyme related to lactoylglutathione lyase